MKKTIMLIGMVMMALLILVGCGNDDEITKHESVSTAVSGVYDDPDTETFGGMDMWVVEHHDLTTITGEVSHDNDLVRTVDTNGNVQTMKRSEWEELKEGGV